MLKKLRWGVLADASGQGHPAVCVGACPALVPGTLGQAAEFAATGDYLEIIDDGALASPAGLTVMSWFSLRSLTGRTGLVTKPLQSSSNNSWSLVIESDGRPLFFSTDPDNVDN